MVLIAPISEPVEDLVYENSNIRLKIGDLMIGRGKLCLSHNFLAFQADHMDNGIHIRWKEIAVHGITNPEKNVFFIMDKKLIWPGIYGDGTVNMNGHMDHEVMEYEGANSDTEDDEEMTDVTLISGDQDISRQINLVMAELQALNPDTDEGLENPQGQDLVLGMMEDLAARIAADNEEYEEEEDDDEDSGFELEQNMDRSDDNENDTTEEAENRMRNLNLDDPRFEDADE